MDDAVSEFALGRWAEARALFARGYALCPNARALRGLGMADFNLREYSRAVHHLELALDHRVLALEPTLRTQTQGVLARADRFVGRYRVDLKPAHASLRVDGGAPMRDRTGAIVLELGPHVLEVSARNHITQRQRLETHGMERQAIVLTALPRVTHEPARARGRTLTWVSAGLSAGFGGVALASHLTARSRFEALERTCRNQGGCFAGDVDTGEVRRLDRLTLASLGLSGALFAAAVTFWFIEKPQPKRPNPHTEIE